MLHFDFRYQQILHRNLVYLASIADSNQNIQALLPVSIEMISPLAFSEMCMKLYGLFLCVLFYAF